MSSNAATEPNAYFEARTKSGEIFGPFPYSWHPELIHCPTTTAPFKARSLGAERWDSWWRLSRLDITGFVPPDPDAIRNEWFRFLRAVARENSTLAQLQAGDHASGFDPLAVEYAGFACVCAIRSPDEPARFDYENGGDCRASISVMRVTRQPQPDSTFDKIFAMAEEWEQYLETRKGSDKFLGQDLSGMRNSEFEPFLPNFFFRPFCRDNPEESRESVIFALRPLHNNYLSIEFVMQESRIRPELSRLPRLLEIIKRMK